jgi:hypothetical protein
MIFFTEVRFLQTYSPLRWSQRSGLFQPFPSLKRSLGQSELLLLNQTGTNFPARTTTQLVSLASVTIELFARKNERKKQSKHKSSKEHVGAKAKTPPFARGLRCSRWSGGDKTGRDTLRSTRHQTKACDEVIPPCGLVQLGGPRAIRPIVTGPAWPLGVTGLICKGIPVITVCNPALWEYSGDNLGV